MLQAEGSSVGTLHFGQVWPLVPEQLLGHLGRWGPMAQAAGLKIAVEALNRVYAVRMRSCTRMYLDDPGPARAGAVPWGIRAGRSWPRR